LLEFIVYGTFISILVLSLASNIVSLTKNQKLVKKTVELALEKFTISKQLEKLLNEKESKKLEETDGFIKFISDSRDWAFKYIEDVQDAIITLESARKQKDDSKIELAYSSLLSFLPKEEEIKEKRKEDKNED
jgi:hypothetical protein